MTLAQAITKARELSRTSTTKTDTTVMGWVNEALIQFSKDIHVQQKEAYPTISPRFDIATNMAIRITITGGTNALVVTDVVICATSANDQTGTQVATALQTALRAAIGVGANLTVTWSTTTWLFTVNAVNSTVIVIEEPSAIIYDDATTLLGLNDTGTTSIIGSMPEDCTVEVDLPTDFLEILSVEWDDIPLTPCEWPESPERFGTPSYYSIYGKKIRLDPSPDHQGKFFIRYKYIPTQFTTMRGYQEVGLSAKTLITATGLANTTTYHFQVRVDVGALVDYTILTASDTTFAAVIALLNAALTTVTWSIEGADLRCTSNTQGGNSAIGLAAGASGNNLFAAFTGWSAFDTAVVHDGNTDLGIESEYCMAIVYYTACLLALANFERTVAGDMLGNYRKVISDHIIQNANNNTKIGPSDSGRLNARIVF
jgi:hypothetical protein